MNLSELLRGADTGDERAREKLFELVYEELKQVAAACMTKESAGHTLQPTALVHEAYLRLMGPPTKGVEEKMSRWDGRAHFFAAAAEAMRRILIDSARRKKRQKRGGGAVRQTIDPDKIAVPELADDLLVLDEGLTRLETIEPRIAQLVKLRYFSGLTLREAASALGMAPRTADSHWAYARAWLLDFIQGAEPPAA